MLTPQDGYWGDVVVDSYIKDRAGTTWRICAVDMTVADDTHTGALRCKNREGEWLTISPKNLADPVTLMVSEDDDEPYIALLRDVLGASVIASKSHEETGWHCDPWPEKNSRKGLADWKAHLELAHHIHTGDMRTYARLLEAHEAAHDPDQPLIGKHLPHDHNRRTT